MLNCYSIGFHISVIGNAKASIQLPRKGTIKKVVWAIANEVAPTSDCSVMFQLSKRPALQSGSVYQQPTEIVDNAAVSTVFGTAVGFAGGTQVNKESDQAFPVNTFDVLYIHAGGNIAGAEYLVDCLVWVQE